METPPFMKSWVDITSISNPSTPPHPHQTQLPATTSTDTSTSSYTAISNISDIPSAVPHTIGTSNPLNSAMNQTSTRELHGRGQATMSTFEEAVDSISPLFIENRDEYSRLMREAQKESNNSSTRVSRNSSRMHSAGGSPKSPPNSPNNERSTGLNDDEEFREICYINYFGNGAEGRNKVLLKPADFNILPPPPPPSIAADLDHVMVQASTETDWIWDWSSRPDQSPPKNYNFPRVQGSPCSGGSSASGGATRGGDSSAVSSRPTTPVLDPTPIIATWRNRGLSLRMVRIGDKSLFSNKIIGYFLLSNVVTLLVGTGIGYWMCRKSSSQIPQLEITQCIHT